MRKKHWFVGFVFSLAVVILGQQMEVAATSIVDETKTYTYEILVEDMKLLKNKYPEIIDYKSLGRTKYGRDIWAIRIGNADTNVFINGSHHAREWISSTLNMKMIEEYAKAYVNNNEIGTYDARAILDKTSIWFVPMVNPDGVTLQQKGLNSFPATVHNDLIEMNNGSLNFTRWRANAEGVDLNRQYPANWRKNSTTPSPSWGYYTGEYPFQTLETQMIRDFTYEIDPQMATSYHSSGRVLFWYFHNGTNLDRDYQLAKELGNITDYKLISANSTPSGRGYTDWFIQEFKKPGFTPELSYYVGDKHVPLSVFPEIWERNKTVGLWMAEEGNKIKIKEKIDKALGVSQWYEVNNNFYNALYYARNAYLISANDERVRNQIYEASKLVADNAYHAFHAYDDITSEKLYKALYEFKGVPDVFKIDAKINLAYTYFGRGLWYLNNDNIYNAKYFLQKSKEYGNTNQALKDLYRKLETEY